MNAMFSTPFLSCDKNQFQTVPCSFIWAKEDLPRYLRDEWSRIKKVRNGITRLKCVNLRSVRQHSPKWVPSNGSMAPCRSHHRNHTRKDCIYIYILDILHIPYSLYILYFLYSTNGSWGVVLGDLWRREMSDNYTNIMCNPAAPHDILRGIGVLFNFSMSTPFQHHFLGIFH